MPIGAGPWRSGRCKRQILYFHRCEVVTLRAFAEIKAARCSVHDHHDVRVGIKQRGGNAEQGLEGSQYTYFLESRNRVF